VRDQQEQIKKYGRVKENTGEYRLVTLRNFIGSTFPVVRRTPFLPVYTSPDIPQCIHSAVKDVADTPRFQHVKKLSNRTGSRLDLYQKCVSSVPAKILNDH
jgi:hypothetical protein